MNDVRDDDTGQFVEKEYDYDILLAIRQLDDRATTTAISERTDIPRRSVNHRLNELRKDGFVEREQIGRSYLWSTTLMTDFFASVPEIPEGYRRPLLECYKYLREYGSATKSDFVRDVYPNASVEFEDGETWWSTIGGRWLKRLAEVRPDIHAPSGRGASEWVYTGD